jgi:hypothetical protein
LPEEKKNGQKQNGKKTTDKKVADKKPNDKKSTNKKPEKKADNKKPVDKKAENKKPADKKVDNNNKPAKQKAEKFLEYKGKPLVRSGNTVYYGNMSDPYVICLNVKNTNNLKDLKLADTVSIQLISTDDSLPPKERIIKKSEKKGLFTALDLGSAWLERQLKKG